jgi:hypothetical protein
MLELIFTFLFCAITIFILMLADAEEIGIIGIVISVMMLFGSQWSSSFSKRSNKKKMKDRLIVLGVGWITGVASLGFLYFAILFVFFIANAIIDFPEWRNLPFIIIPGLVSLLGIPAILMERRIKKNRKLETSL